VVDLEKIGGPIERGAEKVVETFDRDVVAPALHAIAGELQGAESDLSSSIETVAAHLSGVAHDLANNIAGAESDLEHYADAGIAALERDVLDPALHELNELAADAIRSTDELWSEVVGAAELVWRCADWLGLLAIHTVEDIVDLPAEISAMISPEAIERYVETDLAGDLDTANAFLAGWVES
jgi:hypothetical protein